MGGSVTTLIVLALVFVFVALRLWSVLGRRTGHEQTLVKPESVPTVRAVSLKVPDATLTSAPGQEPTPSASAASGLRAIAAADSQFDVARFVEGAKAAYGMVLEAYWKGDQESLDKMKQAIAQGPQAGRGSEFVVYDDAGHAFFADYRPSYKQADAEDGWRRTLAWFKAHGVG